MNAFFWKQTVFRLRVNFMMFHTNVYCFHNGVSPDSVVPKIPISVPFDEAINNKFLKF